MQEKLTHKGRQRWLVADLLSTGMRVGKRAMSFVA
jgi:hypothetical protein